MFRVQNERHLVVLCHRENIIFYFIKIYQFNRNSGISVDPHVTFALQVLPNGTKMGDSSPEVSTILLGIFFTLFSTLWCSIRPDFPSHHDSNLRILSTKLNILFCALLCPEAVLYWAMRQWFEAGRIAKEFRREGFKMPNVACLTDRL